MNKLSIKELILNVENDYKNDILYGSYGWVRTLRTSSNILGFININDGTTTNGLQIILQEDKTRDMELLIKNGKQTCAYINFNVM